MDPLVQPESNKSIVEAQYWSRSADGRVELIASEEPLTLYQKMSDRSSNYC